MRRPITFAAAQRHAKEQFDKAIADYDVAIRLCPRYADALYGRGAARDDQGLPALAIPDLMRSAWRRTTSRRDACVARSARRLASTVSLSETIRKP